MCLCTRRRIRPPPISFLRLDAVPLAISRMPAEKRRLFLYFVKICKQTEDTDQGFANCAKAQHSHENKKKCATVSMFAIEESRGRGPSFVLLASASSVCALGELFVRPAPPSSFFGSIPFHSRSPECRQKKDDSSCVLSRFASRRRILCYQSEHLIGSSILTKTCEITIMLSWRLCHWSDIPTTSQATADTGRARQAQRPTRARLVGCGEAPMLHGRC